MVVTRSASSTIASPRGLRPHCARILPNPPSQVLKGKRISPPGLHPSWKLLLPTRNSRVRGIPRVPELSRFPDTAESLQSTGTLLFATRPHDLVAVWELVSLFRCQASAAPRDWRGRRLIAPHHGPSELPRVRLPWLVPAPSTGAALALGMLLRVQYPQEPALQNWHHRTRTDQLAGGPNVRDSYRDCRGFRTTGSLLDRLTRLRAVLGPRLCCAVGLEIHQCTLHDGTLAETFDVLLCLQLVCSVVALNTTKGPTHFGRKSAGATKCLPCTVTGSRKAMTKLPTSNATSALRFPLAFAMAARCRR